jgi:hypothetical protein
MFPPHWTIKYALRLGKGLSQDMINNQVLTAILPLLHVWLALGV